MVNVESLLSAQKIDKKDLNLDLNLKKNLKSLSKNKENVNNYRSIENTLNRTSVNPPHNNNNFSRLNNNNLSSSKFKEN